MKRVWIELPKAKDLADAQAHCEAANKMLNKLGVDFDVFFATDRQKSCSTYYNEKQGSEPSCGWHELKDRGTWFNLDYFAE